MQETKSKRLSFLARFCTLFAGLTLGSAVVAAAPATALDPTPHVALKTSMGEIVLELNQEKAPQSVANFLQYVKSGYYKGTVFHRVIDGFMIQGGGFDKNMKQKATKAPIKNEAQNGLQNVTYSIAMARTGDPHSATAQFFINVNDNGALDYPGRDGFGYTVFGKVIKGMDVVDKIKAVPVADKGPHQNVPVTPVVIESATLLKPAPAKL
ncbi:peptidyl-prolyl cis-trans isomerase A precursor [Janthinobacterium sp. HH107]|uniref:peptidylprolyl isomerase n=1 Tax=unclassified Janthinobacterium TaxID=2610881 RepID=UPI0008931DF9|nr:MULTISPECIES: peptidylprolyl isomerase [unclassified Janthinobacterium]OEZ89574.1 peptidyl-prolyl cis-trans isomerase A precursor [Janthinobacterium sp. HH106]OEZ97276.1 peptidyl-prolyl cis-trans isomerase A precursor [Janthinobacterium sp. HH107]